MRRILLLSFFLLGCSYTFATTYIVCAGIANYPGIRNDLRVSDIDAATINKIFRSTKNTRTVLLTNNQATQSALLQAMNNLFAQARPDDTVILFFSGHGVPGGLVPYDGPMAYSSILSVFKRSQARRKIIIADACYSGKMRNGSKKANNYSNQSVMFFLSSRTNEVSRESPYKNSIFTIYLERGLRGGADTNRDRVITAKELYDFVHKGVIAESGNTQHPVMWGKFDNNMPVIRW